ncbi:hypothetical protein CEXT_599611 [Caerostris extrusa]|uniref:C2H2-type domain-containing protein n=1 Tax=Caerostris extrusa TaxID=172846 RepID=A0AAV4XMK0_CAEEX|nr:hypothetical protein CEXT_599611 [Caerostris extrusa]
MSLLVHPKFETLSLNAHMGPSNGIYERSSLFVTDPFRTSAFTDFRTVNPYTVPSYFWKKDCFNNSKEILKPTSEYYESDLEISNMCKNLWSPLEASSSKLDFSLKSCKSTDKPRNTELWRPFSPPPLEEVHASNGSQFDESQRYYSNFPGIIPSPVKIGTSSTSLFKPVKKKKYSCSNCPSVFFNGGQLKSHMRRHKGIKPYKCEFPECSKTFARNEELTRHRRIHSGYKPFHCHVCGKSFCRKDHLSKHLKTHLQISEKKIYMCCVPGCEHRYTRSDALTRHKSTAHSLQTPTTDPENKKNK